MTTDAAAAAAGAISSSKPTVIVRHDIAEHFPVAGVVAGAILLLLLRHCFCSDLSFFLSARMIAIVVLPAQNGTTTKQRIVSYRIGFSSDRKT